MDPQQQNKQVYENTEFLRVGPTQYVKGSQPCLMIVVEFVLDNIRYDLVTISSWGGN